MTEEYNTSEPKELTIKIKKQDLWKYATFLFAALFVISLFWNPLGNDSGGGTGNVIPTPTPTPTPTQPSQVSASADDDPFLGDENAPVTIIEFSDYQCPFCARFWSQTLPQIKSEYIDTGKVKFVYRDFPLDSIHPMATPAAIAAECVREQGGDKAYFEYHDKIFAGQPSLSIQSLKTWSQELGYNIDNCLDEQKFLQEVRKDLQDAQSAGGRGTPYFVINDKPLSGAQPFAAFQQIIEAELA